MTFRIEHERLRRIRRLLGIEHIMAIAHVDLGFEMRRLEMIIANLEQLPEGYVRIGAMPR